MKIVLVYIGNEAPPYVYKNLDYLREIVGIAPILITDNHKTFAKCSSMGIKTWMAPKSQKILADIYGQMAHPRDFRSGFWFNTVARFASIAAFMESHPGESVLQVEADVWISPNFPFTKFSVLDSQIAFGLETATTGSAALLYLRDINAAEELLEVMKSEFEVNSLATDMTILGKVFTESLMNTTILPSIPPNYDSRFIFADQRITKEISQNCEYFGGVFDPITLGLYITGEDPKNHRGIVRMYQNYAWHNYGISMDSLELGMMGLPFLGAAPRVPVFSIHNHAKEIKLFDSKKYLTYIRNQVSQSRKGPRANFKIRVFIAQFGMSIKRRIRRHA